MPSSTSGPTSAFYDLNFQTGQATLLDFFDDQVVDVALPVNQN